VVTFKDVTLRRFEEQQARHDTRHAALSRLAEGIAGYLDLELSAVAEESTRLLNALPPYSTLRSSAQTIKSAALDAFGVTARLRAFGEEREIKPQMIQVNEVLSELAKTWRAALPGLTVQPDPSPRPVHADARELTRVLEVLMQHARHWIDSGGAIKVEASGAELEGLHEWVRIRVSYQSTGEDAQGLDRAFDPSWDGNWDGLPFTYGVAKRMGGLLRVHMEPDKNVVFSVYLPSVEVLAAGASTDNCQELMLLVIERNSEVRRSLQTYFDQHGYHVLGAANCEEALLLAQEYEQNIRLVIANPAADDKFRPELPARLLELNPEVSVRLIEGYREKRPFADTSKGEAGWHYVTKRELLEWANQTSANQALGTVARLSVAN
jgi:two-component system cell cycle sensor histidine kinase/response regulator CckA